MALTEDQKQEVLKLQKVLKQYEGILRTSRNPEQISRTKKEIKKIQDQIEMIAPGGLSEDILASSRSNLPPQPSYVVLKDFPIQRASPKSDDEDVNLLYTVLLAWENEFLPAQSDSHTKLDFSLGAERDSHYTILENCKRHLKSLVDTIESYHQTNREDLKAQLRDMKQRYTRHFLQEGYQFLKKMRDFWKKVEDDIRENGMRCLSKDETIVFDKRFEQATYFQGKKVREMVRITNIFLDEAIAALNIPEINFKDTRR